MSAPVVHDRAPKSSGPALGWSHEFRAVGAIWLREFKVFTRERSRVISSMFQPILWIAFVGTGLQAAVDAERLGGADYQSFIFPGVLVMSTLFGTIFYGLYIIWDRKLDVLKEVLVAPVSRATIFFGKVVGGSTEAVIQAVFVLTAGYALATLAPFAFAEGMASTPVWALLPALAVVLLTAIGFVSVGLFIGSFFESLEGFQVVASFLTFPLFFLSGALYPLDSPGFPTWLGVVARLNPVTYAVDALRGLLIGHHAFPYWLDFGVLIGFAVVMIGAGTWAFNRMR